LLVSFRERAPAQSSGDVGLPPRRLPCCAAHCPSLVSSVSGSESLLRRRWATNPASPFLVRKLLPQPRSTRGGKPVPLDGTQVGPFRGPPAHLRNAELQLCAGLAGGVG